MTVTLQPPRDLHGATASAPSSSRRRAVNWRLLSAVVLNTLVWVALYQAVRWLV